MRKRNSLIICGVVLIIVGITGLSSTGAEDGSLFVASICFIGAIICFISAQRNSGSVPMAGVKDIPIDMSAPLPQVPAIGLILRYGEMCYAADPVQTAKPKNVVTGYSGSSGGMSVRVAKGVTLRSGSSRGKPIRKTILEKSAGTLFITNQRIVASAPQYGFEKKLSDLTAYNLLSDGLNLMFGKQSYLILTGRPKYLLSIILAASAQGNLPN